MAKSTIRILSGLLFIALGVMWALSAAGVITRVPFWPLAVIALGIVIVINSPRSIITALVIGGFGVLLLLESLGVLSISAWALLPALIVVGIGLGILFRPGHGGSRWSAAETVPGGPAGESTRTTLPADESRGISPDEVTAILGGAERIYQAGTQFSGAKVTAILGGAKLDLSRCTVVDGAVIDLYCVLGGFELWVTPDISIIQEATAVLGGISNGSPSTGARLILRGTTILGGGEIKRVG